MKRCLFAISTLLALSHASAAKQVGALTDFGDPNAASLSRSFAAEKPLRWAQLGDSHTAGEYFTGELRTLMQKRFGDGGPGWFYPGYIRQQRFDLAKLSNGSGWDLTVSRATSSAGGAVGGVEGLANRAGAGFSLVFKQALLKGNYHLKALVQPQAEASTQPLLLIENNGAQVSLKVDALAPAQSWQVLTGTHSDPLNEWVIQSPSSQSARLAGIWIDALDTPLGASLDALGLNGAKMETTALWDMASFAVWLHERQPSIVVFAYGTNEALDPQFSPNKWMAVYGQLIQTVRRNSTAAVLLVGPPDLYMPPKRTVRQTIKLANGKKKMVNKKVKIKVACDAALPPNYEAVHHAIRSVAAKEKTMYWDWQAAMGGRCAMREAAQTTPPLAQPDGVHMTAEGYVTYARQLWADMVKLHPQNHK